MRFVAAAMQPLLEVKVQHGQSKAKCFLFVPQPLLEVKIQYQYGQSKAI